jgi:hypothetical protein
VEKLLGGSCKEAYTFIFLQNAHFCAKTFMNHFKKIDKLKKYPRMNTGAKWAMALGSLLMNSLRLGGFEKARPMRVSQPPSPEIQTGLSLWGMGFLGDQKSEKSLVVLG